MHLRADVIEAAPRSGSLRGGVGPAGYVVGCALAAANPSLGRTVVAASFHRPGITRTTWRDAGRGRAVRDVETICSDAAERRPRVEARRSDLRGLVVPDWSGVLSVTYEPTGPGVLRPNTASRGAEGAAHRIIAAAGGGVPA